MLLLSLSPSQTDQPTTRLITEAIRIEELPDENSMNEKTEWNYVQLGTILLVRTQKLSKIRPSLPVNTQLYI